ncbi:PAS domain S-box-containing protein [Mycobacterium sp. OAS707]|uniref:SpoIIE family protein phosphatase n=1 Tax=Mycobacterium sp. OAS707 TaxID=2663822 RepID=UPI00178A09EE|nr:SpoIIE family protein phosphatase [Mycobacterium sp. OAS707]MBE1550596.1 PAS domain S-box-containing protein [Mycobacterium sp. OAS707]
MTPAAEFHASYAAALSAYLAAQGEDTLAVGHELGRRALAEQISILDIIENHARLVAGQDSAVALQFLLQTLATLDVATRGFIDGTKRYEQQRARADDLADRDEFRTALVNSLQEGFFVSDSSGAVIEVNEAFADITGYGPEGLPYAWQHPWMADDAGSGDRLSRLLAEGTLEAEAPIRHRDGHTVWVAMSVNKVTSPGAEDAGGTYVGTIRDITAPRAAAERERAVAHLATAVSVAKSIGEVLSATLDECRTRLGVRQVAAIAWPPSEYEEPTVHLAGTPVTVTWHDLEPELRRSLDDARAWLPLSVETVGWATEFDYAHGIVATLTRDLTLWLEFDAPRRVGAEDRQLVAALAGHLSLAMQHVRQFELARDTSLTLQRAMLAPTELPPGFAARYEPAVSPLEIGGDWYDVLPVGDDRIGIIVGDCVGRGLAAAAVMGQLRSSARALLLTGESPATLLEHLDSVAAFIPDAFCTTVFVAILDAQSETLSYSSAGHVPAVLADVEAEPQLLIDARSVPLAVHRDEPRPQATTTLTGGSTLLLYTDGLVERRGEPIDAGIARVGDVLTRTTELPVDTVADTMLEQLAPALGYDDDVAIVLYRHPGPALVIEIDAIPARLTDVRHQLTAWLHSAGVSEMQAADIVLVVNEACSNSAEHAYRGQDPGPMRVEGAVDDQHIHIRVADSGSWKTPPADPGTRGRGLLLMRTLSDKVDLEGTAHGTTVGMRFAVG